MSLHYQVHDSNASRKQDGKRATDNEMAYSVKVKANGVISEPKSQNFYAGLGGDCFPKKLTAAVSCLCPLLHT